MPRCSGDTEALRTYLVANGRLYGQSVSTDKAGNILVRIGRPKVCLQAHYDMVCVGKAPRIKIEEADGWIRAREASLGADNGIGVAMMLTLIEEGMEGEYLFTADEEIGLVGAKALDLPVRSKYFLNLDSETEGVVTIGCAGGADVVGQLPGTRREGSGTTYEVAVRGLPGGHSGVDIDRNIPNAIKELFGYLHDKGVDQIASVIAGQRRNAIPTDAVAIVRSEKRLRSRGSVSVRKLKETPQVYTAGRDLVEWVYAFTHGVHAFNDALGIPQTSINLALINDTYDPPGIRIETSARAMSEDDLNGMIDRTVLAMEAAGMAVTVEERYPAWKPERNAWVDRVAEAMRQEMGDVSVEAIHAGLECGVLKEKFPDAAFASIGPTIRYPHSTREELDADSVERTFEVVNELMRV
jgi:dipeptidase D